jgi:hypothetical protein
MRTFLAVLGLGAALGLTACTGTPGGANLVPKSQSAIPVSQSAIPVSQSAIPVSHSAIPVSLSAIPVSKVRSTDANGASF